MVFIQPSIVADRRSLESVQIDMDSRYKVATDSHAMADGPGMVPDVSALHDKSGSTSRKTAPASEYQPSTTSGSSTLKPTIRPVHRR